MFRSSIDPVASDRAVGSFYGTVKSFSRKVNLVSRAVGRFCRAQQSFYRTGKCSSRTVTSFNRTV